ncbi:MAG: hypothetical protein R3293_09390 [Candidatus Promineifilaceae bacterium]|nr:hypothetical protein [Candidatus Promineifilaceae bacterium]
MSKYLLLLGLILTACGAESSVGQTAKAEKITCHTAYRNSVSQAIEHEETLIFTDIDEEQSISFADMAFHAAYATGEGDNERSLRLWVTDAEGEGVLQTQLYQLALEDGPQNQFVGGHGFTGLNYSYHPETTAELQFWCVAG